MFVGRKFGSNWFAGTSVGGLILGVLVFGFILIGTPIMLVVELFRSLTPLGAVGWMVIGVLAAAVVGGIWMFLKAGPNPGYMSPEERAEIMAMYPDPDEPEVERLRPNRLRRPGQGA